MRAPTDLFLRAVNETSLALKRALGRGSPRVALNRYKSHLGEVSQRYNPSRKITGRELDKRFRTEASSVAVLINIIDKWFAANGIPPLASMTVNGIEAYYPSVQIPLKADSVCSDIAKTIRSPNDLAKLLYTASRQVVDHNSKYVLSEYYTPQSIAKELADYAFPAHVSSSDHLRMVDPACGHGYLLVLLAKRYAQRLERAGKSADDIVFALLNSVYGFDIQPYSVILTRLNLVLQIAPWLKQARWADKHIEETIFSNVILSDPLQNCKTLWESDEGFDIVIANPPYSRVINSHVPFIGDYEDVIYGHANLYQLFLWWAIKAARADGRISFLIPQSFRSGQYFEKLRQKIGEQCAVNKIAHIGLRASAFENVQQPLVCVALRKRSAYKSANSVTTVSIFQNGTEGHEPVPAKTFNIKSPDLLRTFGKTVIWIVSDKKSDYEILDKVMRLADAPMGASESIKITNGGFVWNQKKSILRAKSRLGRPLISAASISPFHIEFPVSPDTMNFDRQIVIPRKELGAPLYETETLLVQRTTSKKSGRRIVGAPITRKTLSLSDGYYVENHVNVIQIAANVSSDEKQLMLWGLTGWVNSRLLNFVFDMMNGSAHISTYELKMLPLPEELLSSLSLPAKNVAKASKHTCEKAYEKLDMIVSNHFHLTKQQLNRVRAKVR